MTLPRQVYQTFEDLVGPEHVSEDQAVLDSYIYQWMGEFHGELGNKFLPHRPEAVVCPGSAEEVQTIVKVCNRFGVKFKAHSTGWGAHSVPRIEGVVLLDLRRMNRILELNEQDAYAVVEPYVNWAQLQAEAMKRGLNCSIIWAGSNTSVLANITSYMGVSGYNATFGYNDKNVLAVEWVLPDGEILRLGSLGSEAGWISGDGPGPSLRGMMRGQFGAKGGLGIFTKCAVRLYHWPGPPALEAVDIHPRRQRLKEFPKNLDICTLAYGSRGERNDAYRRIGEAEIGYVVAYIGMGLLVGLVPAAARAAAEVKSMREFLKGLIPEASLNVLLAANSPREFEYQKRVLDRIVEETGGSFSELELFPGMKDGLILFLVKVGNMPCGEFMMGSFSPTMSGTQAAWRTITSAETLGVEIKRKYIEKGLAFDDAGDGVVGFTYDYGHIPYVENDTLFCHFDPAFTRSHLEMLEETNRELLAKNLALPYLPEVRVDYSKRRDTHERMGAFLGNYHVWLKRIKRAFDPKGLSDHSDYVSSE